MFSGPLYMLSKSFRAKTVTLHSDQNSWPLGPRGISVQNLHEFFFFFSFISKEFSICFLDLYICYLQVFAQKCRHCIPVKNSWPVGLRGIFVQNLLEFFFFFPFILKNLPFVSWTFIYAINKFSCKNTNIAFQLKFLIS